MYTDSKIMYYGKITEEVSVSNTFAKEIQVLNFLKKKGVKNIPEVISDKKIGNMHFFLQSTNKSLNDKVKLNFGKQHIAFVDELVKKTKEVCFLENTDLFKEIQFLKKKLFINISNSDSEVIQKAIDIIEKKSSDEGLVCSFCHGDFTPWNIYYQNNQLNVFDFEYSEYKMPAYIDIYHYLTQLSLLGYNSGDKKSMTLYEKHRNDIKKVDSNCDFSYMCYLIHIIAFYFMRTDFVKNIDDVNFSHERISVLKYLLESVKK